MSVIVLNTSDEDAKLWIKIFTFLSKEEIDALVSEHNTDAGKRTLQKKMATEITLFVHGKEGYNKAIETTEKLFANQNASADALSEDDLQNMEGIVKISYPETVLSQGMDVVSFLAETSIFPSKGEARKMVQNGGVSINREKISDIGFNVNNSLLLHKKYLLVQRGKKNFYLVISGK
jgi:tyrosyl-tRNA synthetase